MKAYRIQKVRKNKFFFGAVWFMFVLFISVAASRFVLFRMYDALGIGREEKNIVFELQENTNLFKLSEALEKHGLIKYKFSFIVYALLRKSPKSFDSIDIELKTNLDYETILRKFKLNNSNVSREVIEITFIEGMTITEYADLLENSEVCSKDEFLKLCDDEKTFAEFEVLKNLSKNKGQFILAEGFLFPDTYKFYKKDSAKNVIRKILSNFVKKFTVYKKAGEEYTLQELFVKNQNNFNLEKIITLASLISAEAANIEDMFNVSSVIHNRLRTISTGGINRFGEYGMNVLRIDATLNYLKKNKFNNTKDNPYDTYKIIGLPPGPICSPGYDAIYAAICPKNTSYFYYCHSKDGMPFYAQTNDIHIANRHRAGLE